MPFVIVAERGEYSDFSYEVLSVHESEEAANQAIAFLTRKNRLECEIAKLSGKWCDHGVNYEVFDVPSYHDVNQEDIIELEKELESTQAWCPVYDKEKEQQKELQKNKLLDEQRTQIAEFIEWWDTQSYLADKEKKKTRLDAIIPIVKNYLLHRFDAEVRELLYLQP